MTLSLKKKMIYIFFKFKIILFFNNINIQNYFSKIKIAI